MFRKPPTRPRLGPQNRNGLLQPNGAIEGDRSMFSADVFQHNRIFSPKNGPVPRLCSRPDNPLDLTT